MVDCCGTKELNPEMVYVAQYRIAVYRGQPATLYHFPISDVCILAKEDISGVWSSFSKPEYKYFRGNPNDKKDTPRFFETAVFVEMIEVSRDWLIVAIKNIEANELVPGCVSKHGNLFILK